MSRVLPDPAHPAAFYPALILQSNILSRAPGPYTLNRDVFYAAGEREFFIGNLLVRIHLIIEMIWWTGLAPCEFEFPFPGSFMNPQDGWVLVVGLATWKVDIRELGKGNTKSHGARPVHLIILHAGDVANLLVRMPLIFVMIRWTGLAP